METGILKKFAQEARRNLQQEVSAKLDWVLKTDSAELRESAGAVEKLKKELAATSRDAVVEKAAYTWFNRFCALRFMDVKGYTRMGIVSPAPDQTQPEILAEAKMGHIDDRVGVNETRVRDLLSGRIPSRDAEGEAYRLLLVAVCNDWNPKLPFLFERIADWTELLMPDDLLSGASLLSQMREVLTEENCQDVEVIGWLYQFYISEKKDAVFEALKKSKKIEAENIPAATQLFTPHWIVRYLVENSLGRLWMQNRPGSKLAERMDYYIPDEDNGKYCEGDEPSYLKIASPEEIKICDPACGSGHMLVYAFELLAAIYEEEGYAAKEIPALILKKNLVGIEIDPRAGSLAAFALVMKACETHRRFIKKPVFPKVCVLKEVVFTEAELDAYMKDVGDDLFTHNLRPTLEQFADAAHFGSLIRPMLEKPSQTASYLEKQLGEDLFQRLTHLKVMDVLAQAEALATKYHVVVANPPYMGGKGMNAKLKAFAGKYYKDSKSDLFAMFVERNIALSMTKGLVSMITMQSWMFLSSYEKLREKILKHQTIASMAHFGARAFDSIGGEVVSTTAFVLEHDYKPEYKGAYLRLVEGKSEADKQEALSVALHSSSLKPPMPSPSFLFRASASDFQKIPGAPIAYWLSERVANSFQGSDPIGDIFEVKSGLTTGDNDTFILFWHEVDSSEVLAGPTNRSKFFSHHNKGGDFRKWYGNNEYVLKYGSLNIEKMEQLPGFRFDGKKFFYREMIGWSKITSSKSSFRYYPTGFSFNTAGLAIFEKSENSAIDLSLLGFLNSKTSEYLLKVLNPTLNFSPGVISKIPYIRSETCCITGKCIELTKIDWDSSETSWDFEQLPLLSSQRSVANGQEQYKGETIQCPLSTKLSEAYAKLRSHWQKRTLEMQRLEEENNRIFNKAYGLEDELTPDVPLNEITLTCNPHYRYGNKKSHQELESLLLADTMKEFISYAVGCMFGRYSLDKPGLILANQGDTLETYLDQIPEPTFLPDDDNVIPILEEGWFTDDITVRFYHFLRVTFGVENFEDNIDFIEAAIGKDVRKYFLTDFYTDHVKRYKKRPIYWMFESPKKSFRCLIYMHRYQPDTVSVMLNNYLRDYRSKLSSRIQHFESIEVSASAGKSEKAKAIKEMDKLRKIIIELEAWERDVIFPMAGRQIGIDLDDGVKVNYRKFDGALKKITGL